MTEDMGYIFGELEDTLASALQNYYIKVYRYEEEFQWAQRDFLMYIMEATYWQKMKFIGSVLRFLTNVFTIILCLWHWRITYAALMALDKIIKVYRRDAAEQHHTRAHFHTSLLTNTKG